MARTKGSPACILGTATEKELRRVQSLEISTDARAGHRGDRLHRLLRRSCLSGPRCAAGVRVGGAGQCCALVDTLQIMWVAATSETPGRVVAVSRSATA